MSGITSNNLPRTALADEVLINRNRSTARLLIADLAQQLLAQPAFAGTAFASVSHFRETLDQLMTVTAAPAVHGAVLSNGPEAGIYERVDDTWLRRAPIPAILTESLSAIEAGEARDQVLSILGTLGTLSELESLAVRGEVAAVTAALYTPAYYDGMADLRAATTAWPTGTILNTRDGGWAEVVATDPDFSNAGAAPVVIRPNVSGEFSVAAFVSAADGGDIGLAIQRAVNRAGKTGGGLIKLPPGNYTAATTAQVGEQVAAQVRADGAAIMLEANVPIFRSSPPVWEAVQDIAPVDGNNYWLQRKTVTVTDGTAFALDDLVKVFCDDKQRCTRAASGDGRDFRIAFMAFIEAIVGDVITLDRPIPWSLTANPRIARMPRRRYDWRGGVVGYEAGHEADWRAIPFMMYGASDLTLDVEIEKTYAAGVSIVGCFEASIRARGRDLRNDEGNQQYGYLVTDGSFFSRVDIMAGRNRHGYTTNMDWVVANSAEINRYGATYGALVTGQSHGNTQSGFDTHHGAENITFMNTVVSGGTKGGGQYVLRGHDIRLINPVGYNGKHGIFVYTEDGVVDPTTVSIVSPNIDVDTDPLVMGANSRAEVTGPAKLRSRKYGNCIPVGAGSRLTFVGDILIRPGAPAEQISRRVIETVDAIIDNRQGRVTFDLQDIPPETTNFGIVQLGGDNPSQWIGGKLETINDDNLTRCFWVTGLGVHAVDGIELITQKLGPEPSTRMAVTGANNLPFIGRWTWKHRGGGGGSEGMTETFLESATVNTERLRWLDRGDPKVFARIYIKGDPALPVKPDNFTLPDLPIGNHVGQTLLISVTADPHSSGTGSKTLTLRHGTGFRLLLPSGGTLVLSAEQGVALSWTGTVWAMCA